MGGQGIAEILNSPWFDRGLAVVLVFVLLNMMHRDIGSLTSAITKLSSEMANSQSSIVHRQEEIREGLSRILQFWSERWKP